ncbi:ABC transporter ATP-binding protein [Lentzea sp. JNUCC 0626]|uniref:ABC transporter ATP-binding protein n=1 Tax=Lentzea sp. JNUCC 0626 TaxID=3367513 RepID=UPI0037493088
MSRRLPLATAGEVRRAVREYLRDHRSLAAATMVLAVAASLSGLVAPWVVGRMVDEVIGGADAASVVGLTVLVGVAGLGAAVLTALSGALVARIGQRVLARMREDTVAAALRMPAAEVEETGRGDLLSRVGDDVAVVSEVVATLLAQWVGAVLTVGLTMVGLFALDPWLAVAGLLAIPVYGFALRWYLPRAAVRYTEERAAFGDRAETLVSALEGLPTLRAYGAEERHVGLIEESSGRARDVSRSILWFSTAWGKWINIAELVGLVSIVITGFVLVRTGSASVGAVTAAALYFHRLFNPLGLLVFSFDQVQSAMASLQRIVGVIGTSEPSQAVSAPARTGDLHAEAVTHRYPGTAEPVLHEVSLRLRQGETVALVGASGAGKSTLAVLLAGITPPSEGRVSWAGAVPDRAAPLVLVTQETHVFAGPLAEDLRLADPDATDEDAEKALRAVGADWIDELPDGVLTVVGELGRALDPTQTAQVALARALLADPAVVLLDEATAEADSRDATRLEDAASAVLDGRTGLVVAHRLRQAAAADRVLVLEHGRIVESGTHDELIAADGHYAQLWAAWESART